MSTLTKRTTAPLVQQPQHTLPHQHFESQHFGQNSIDLSQSAKHCRRNESSSGTLPRAKPAPLINNTPEQYPSLAGTCSTEECDDCGMIGTSWASLSHGTLLCDECASAHRNLGRHVSQVRCLKAGSAWPNSQFRMLFELSSGRKANGLLEYEISKLKLVNGTNNRLAEVTGACGNKPCAFDDYQTKYCFIRQKYELLAFVKRYNKAAAVSTSYSASDLTKINAELRKAVQANDILRVLWLLLCGANPNGADTCNRYQNALCDSAALGRGSIMELLCIWGGDLSAADLQCVASVNGYVDVADRISELENELVDRIVDCVKRRLRRIDNPVDLEHRMKLYDGCHLPDLKQLPDSSFVDLLKDIFDEIERREHNQLAILVQSRSKRRNTPGVSSAEDTSGNCEDFCVPFLPVITQLSATRNQGRQKLARFTTADFYLFLADVVSDMKRRKFDYVDIRTRLSRDLSTEDKLISSQYIKSWKHVPDNEINHKTVSVHSNNDLSPVYDQVASEHDDSDGSESAHSNVLVDATEGKDWKLRVMRLENQLKQVTCVNEELRHQMLSLRSEILKYVPPIYQPLNADDKRNNQSIEMSGSELDTQCLTALDEARSHRFVNNSNARSVDLRVSQNMESDYDNAARTTSQKPNGALTSTESTIVAPSASTLTTNLDEMNEPFNTAADVDYVNSPCFQDDRQTSISTSRQISIEDAVIKVISLIGQLHSLIKKHQRAEYVESSKAVADAVHQLCHTVHTVNNVTYNIIYEMDIHANKLIDLSNDYLFNNNNCARKTNPSPIIEQSDCLDSSITQFEHSIIDCCYQIGSCTKSLVTILSSFDYSDSAHLCHRVDINTKANMCEPVSRYNEPKGKGLFDKNHTERLI